MALKFMKDYMDKELKVGDKVIFIEQGYREFNKSTVKEFTKEKVRLTNNLLQWPNQLIKIGISL